VVAVFTLATACRSSPGGLAARPLPATPAQTGAAAAPSRSGDTERWWGVTLDDVSDPVPIADSLAALPKRPIVRMVFDKDQSPADYAEAISAVRPTARLLATPVDSSDAKGYDLDHYVARFKDYLAAYGSEISAWEIGNEINGEWTGGREESAAKAAAAFDLVHAAGGRTALTLYYNPDCFSDPGNAMLRYARTELPERVKAGVDYVLVSYYEADCNGHQPAAQEWRDVFTGLRGLFPSARLGFGEVGAPESASPEAKAEYLRRYYTMPDPVPGFIGGFFWWYYAEDAVPYTGSPVWAALRAAMTASGSSRPQQSQEPEAGSQRPASTAAGPTNPYPSPLIPATIAFSWSSG
jgi:hypothetical protein